MLERIILAAVVTFCIYLFLNLGTQSSNTPLETKSALIPGFVRKIASFSF